MSPQLCHVLIFLCCLKGVLLYYSYDQTALAICTAETNGSMLFYARVLAVRRSCRNKEKCEDICKKIGSSYHCFDAVHIYGRSSSKYLSAYRYLFEGCGVTVCGPNYCCCGKN